MVSSRQMFPTKLATGTNLFSEYKFVFPMSDSEGNSPFYID
jgi:hypothetical protein